MSDLAELEAHALEELRDCSDEERLRAWHTRYFGKQGAIARALKGIADVAPADRPAFGQEANRVKNSLLAAHEKAQADQKAEALEASLQTAALDVTLPGRPVPRGGLHVVTRTLREIYAIFSQL